MAGRQIHTLRSLNKYTHAERLAEPHGERRVERAQIRVPGISTPEFLAGDIILFASTGDAFSNLSRWLMRGEHEGPTYSVHTGQFLDDRYVLEMEAWARLRTIGDILKRRYWHGPFRSLMPPPAWAQFYDLLNRRFQRYRHLWQPLWKARGFEVWRCTTLTTEQRAALTHEAMKYVNVRFGFLKLSAHALDDSICKLLHKDVFLFRHIDPEDRHPVCSGITAAVYDRALHYRFGVDPECADPDQIYDWVHSHPEEWVRVFPVEETQQPPSARRGSLPKARRKSQTSANTTSTAAFYIPEVERREEVHPWSHLAY